MLAEFLADRAAAEARRRGGPLVVGLTGPQGSGKTTLAAALAPLLARLGRRAAVLALDDLYLPRAERLRLAADVHPLFATRGPPGTHDAALGAAVLASLQRGGPTQIPSFDKGADDRRPARDWSRLDGPFDVVIFEGWCVGARPQPANALARPVNALEREQDPNGDWRAYANDQLAGPYRALFAPIGFQVLLRPPSFEVVLGWRRQQEVTLRTRGVGQSDAELATFIQYYERLTRWIDAEMPPRADVVAELDPDRNARRLTP